MRFGQRAAHLAQDVDDARRRLRRRPPARAARGRCRRGTPSRSRRRRRACGRSRRSATVFGWVRLAVSCTSRSKRWMFSSPAFSGGSSLIAVGRRSIAWLRPVDHAHAALADLLAERVLTHPPHLGHLGAQPEDHTGSDDRHRHAAQLPADHVDERRGQRSSRRLADREDTARRQQQGDHRAHAHQQRSGGRRRYRDRACEQRVGGGEQPDEDRGRGVIAAIEHLPGVTDGHGGEAGADQPGAADIDPLHLCHRQARPAAECPHQARQRGAGHMEEHP